MEGGPGMGESERRRCRLMKGLRPELGPGSAIDYAWVSRVDQRDWVELDGRV